MVVFGVDGGDVFGGFVFCVGDEIGGGCVGVDFVFEMARREVVFFVERGVERFGF